MHFNYIDTSWSKLVDTEMGDYVLNYMNAPGREYHNAEHVAIMWQHAKTLGMDYDATLDAAILWHDFEYDAEPNKELRSAESMQAVARNNPEWFRDVDVGKAAELILTTISHNYVHDLDMRLVKLDLFDLTLSHARYTNFWNILAESVALYGIDAKEAARASEQFLKGFALRMDQNSEADKETPFFWFAVAEGARETVLMSRVVQDTYRYELKNS